MYIGVIHSPVEKVSPARQKEIRAEWEIFRIARSVQEALEQYGHRVEQVSLEADGFDRLARFDWVFNLAESVNGFPLADFEVARTLEELGIPFTGSGSQTLRVCADKRRAKEIIGQEGIRTPAFQTIELGADIRLQMDFPLIVKPAHEDASIGITSRSVVKDLPALEQQVRRVQRTYRQAALIEEYIEGRDISVSFIGNRQRRRILPPSECIYLPGYPGPKILTYASKWKPDSQAYKHSVTRCPCELDDETLARVNEVAARVFRLLDCRDYARVDFRLAGKGLYLLEVNPNPCLSPHDSGFLTACHIVGLSYAEAIHAILEHSIEEWGAVHQSQNRSRYARHPGEKSYPKRPAHFKEDPGQD